MLWNPETILLLWCPVHLTFDLLTPNSKGNISVPWVVHMYDIVTLGRMDNALEPRHNIAKCPVCLTFALLTPNSIGNTFVPWVDHMHDMVTLGGKANTKSLGTILSTDGWTDNLIPVTPPPPTCCRGYNYDKRLPSHSKYSFTFTLISIALKKMLFKCFTYKHYVPSLPPPPPPGQNPYPRGSPNLQFW